MREEDYTKHRTTDASDKVGDGESAFELLSVLVQQGTQKFFLYSANYFAVDLYAVITEAVLVHCTSSGMQLQTWHLLQL